MILPKLVPARFQLMTCYAQVSLASPPYDDMRTFQGSSKFDFEAIAHELYRVLKPGGICVWIVGDQGKKGSKSGTSFRQGLFFMDKVGFNMLDNMIYKKTPRPIAGDNRIYWGAYEFMFILCKGQPKTINLIEDRKNTKRKGLQRNGTKDANGVMIRSSYYPEEYGRRTNVWEYNQGYSSNTKDYEVHKHPAIFPEALAQDHILSWSNEGDLVYDPFMGSGTTAKMAVINGRRWLGSETQADYCNITNNRLSAILI